MSLQLLVTLVSLCVASSSTVTPVEKVITLLQDLETQQKTDAQTEATGYSKFACFCKDMTDTKSTAITTGQDNINTYSATIETKTAEREKKITELADRKAKLEETKKTLTEEEARFAKQKTEYEATAADLSKALSALTSAIQSLEDGKSLLQVKDSIVQSLAIADAMSLISKAKRQAVASFVQQTVDPNDPEYKYHSQGIIDTLEELKKEFTDEKADLDAEWAKTKQASTDAIASLNTKIGEYETAIDQLGTDIDGLKSLIASTREDLVTAEMDLKDDQVYMKDLTQRCEDRANDFDQRSTMRGQEITAISEALSILTTTVKTMDERANNRSFVQSDATQTEHLAKVVSFFQQEATPTKAKAALMQQRSAADVSLEARKTQVADLLQSDARRLRSSALASVAARVAADPFKKVKKLIQDLIERLLSEATAEATKKGFCDEQLAKAEKDRDYRLQAAKNLNSEIAALEVKKDELTLELKLLKDAVQNLEWQLANATDLRKEEHGDNMETIKDAKTGLSAVTEAIVILKSYYRMAAKATVLAQASPVDDDTQGAGFSGAYTGNQAASKGVIGLLEVIQTDFARTVRTTTAAENKAQSEFVEFDRTSKADISGKETKITLDTEDLATTESTMTEKMDSLKTEMDLLDSALKVLEDLKPTCIDTGMSYADRVAKREDEIESLKKALCILDTDSVEPDCQNQR